ncbi:MAG: hypothetical protein ACRD63_09560, partial [Pyrinomonadaceae bacterium]
MLLLAPLSTFGQQQSTAMPPVLSEEVTVTATRTETKIGDTAASVRLIDNEALTSTSALTVDDALRQVPGVILFR